MIIDEIKKYTPLHIMLDKIGAKYEKEYRFDDERRWRFDIAIPDKFIALEYDGGIFNNGRHVRGRGFYNDCEKINMATLKGWRVYRFTILHFNIEFYYSTLDFIKKIVECPAEEKKIKDLEKKIKDMEYHLEYPWNEDR